jgi:hypothetical protein
MPQFNQNNKSKQRKHTNPPPPPPPPPALNLRTGGNRTYPARKPKSFRRSLNILAFWIVPVDTSMKALSRLSSPKLEVVHIPRLGAQPKGVYSAVPYSLKRTSGEHRENWVTKTPALTFDPRARACYQSILFKLFAIEIYLLILRLAFGCGVHCHVLCISLCLP